MARRVSRAFVNTRADIGSGVHFFRISVRATYAEEITVFYAITVKKAMRVAG